ncbi:zinc-binding dehydrogenase, partial [Burkholderia sp. SIMBA_045]
VIASASADNHAYLKGLGADQVIDYRRQDFTQWRPAVDVVLDLVGEQTQALSFALLKRHGVLVSPVSQPDITLANDYGVTPVNFA